MKRCPTCRRDYFDDSLLYCLDDGSMLLDGPATTSETPTAVFRADAIDGNAKTVLLSRGIGRNLRIVLFTILVTAAAFTAYLFFYRSHADDQAVTNTNIAVTANKLYWEMSENEQADLVRKRTAHIFTIMGDEPMPMNDDEVSEIRAGISHYVERKDSLSQKQFEEGMRTIYGRATQYAPMISRTFEAQKVPVVLGIYQAMIESEYRDCPTSIHPRGPVGLFRFNRKTADHYGLKEKDFCDTQKQAEAAARHMSDLLSDFGSEKNSWTLALLGFNIGTEDVRNYLRQMRSHGITDRNYWALRRDHPNLVPALAEDELDYVIDFFAVAIIGETPAAFDLAVPPLTSLSSTNQ